MNNKKTKSNVPQHKVNEVKQHKPSRNVFRSDELLQDDSKYSAYVNPSYNPGVLQRLRSKHNTKRTYEVKKPLHFFWKESEGSKNSVKISVPVGERVTFC